MLRYRALKDKVLRPSPPLSPAQQAAWPQMVFGIVDSGSAGSQAAAARLGYHNDGFLSTASDGDTYFADLPAAACGASALPIVPLMCSLDGPIADAGFAVTTLESPYLPIGGEMFWNAGANGSGTLVVNGHTAAHRLRMQHFTYLSIVHGLSPYGSGAKSRRRGGGVGGGGGGIGGSNAENINSWQSEPLNISRLWNCGGPSWWACGMPAPDAYVAEIANKTSFDYIRDFLGYRIQLNGAYFPSNVSLGGTLSVAIRVTNFGFSAPINPRLVFLVLINATTDAIIFITHFPGVDWRAWQPHVPGDPQFAPLEHFAGASPVLEAGSVAPGRYSLGVFMPDANPGGASNASSFSVRFANRECASLAAAGAGCIFWWSDSGGAGGVNVLGSIDVLPAAVLGETSGPPPADAAISRGAPAEGGAAAPLWPTAVGPPSSSSLGSAAGPTAPLSARFLNGSSGGASWAEDYEVASGGPLLLRATEALFFGRVRADGNFSLLSVSIASGALVFAAPLLVPDSLPGPYSSSCGPLGAALDACGAAYAALGCGPEPLSLMNYIFALDAATGAQRWRARFDGTGGFAALAPSSSCRALFSTGGSRDGPEQVLTLAAADGTTLGAFSPGEGPWVGLNAQQLAFSVAPGQGRDDTLVAANAPTSPFVAAYSVAGDGAAGPDALRFNTTGPDGSGIKNFFNNHVVPPVVFDGGASVALAFDPPWDSAPGAAGFTVWSMPTAGGEPAWSAQLAASAANATMRALGASAKSGALVAHVEYDHAPSGEVFLLDSATGAPLLASPCLVSAPGAPEATVLRGLVIDDLAEGGPTAALLALGWSRPVPPQGGSGPDGRYFQGQGNCTSLELVVLRVAPGSSCAVVSRLELTALLPVSFPVPWVAENTAGLLPLAYPSLAIASGKYVVQVPGFAVLVVEGA